MANTSAPIIIKRIKKAAHAHHRGAWKVAYADFVTAMMAFFLLLWLLNVTTDIERKGIADYFAPASISKSDSGAGGLFGGQTITAPGAQINNTSPIGSSKSIPEPDESESGRKESPGSGQPQGPDSKAKDKVISGPKANATMVAKLEKETQTMSGSEGREAGDKKTGDKEAEKAIEVKKAEEEKAVTPEDAHAKQEELKKQEEESFKKAEAALRNALHGVPGMSELEKNLVIDSTPEGLRIQIVDRDGYSLFATGNASLNEKSRALVMLVGRVLARLPNNITITGHTDDTPFPPGSRRNNWQLSTERAQTSMEAIIQAGVQPDRLMGIIGKADRDPLIKDDPKNSQNRRISIVLLRRFIDVPEEPAPAAAPIAQPPAVTQPVTQPVPSSNP